MSDYKSPAIPTRTLARQAAAGLLGLLLIMWLLIFLPAWTLSYWQGWGFFLAFSVPVTMISVYFLRHDPTLIEARLRAGPTAEHQPRQQLIQALAGVCFLSLILFPALDHHFHWSAMPWYLAIIGDLLVITGLYSVFLVFRENRFTSGIIEVHKEQRVIHTGPYALVRHPMYSGAFVMLLGVPLALGSWWSYLFALLIFAIIINRLLEEERFLADHLPGYTAYCQQVRYRLIPHLW